jgi:Protein of unknown function (DUF3667)
METVTCKNCNTPFQGTYCNQCGQHAIQRFNFSYLWSLLSQDLFEVDRGLWHTMKDLTVRPGYMIHDFLNGKTRQYFSPLKYLIISIGVFYLMMTIGGAISGESGSIESQWTENFFLMEHRLFSFDTMLDFFDVVTALISINMASGF